MYIHELVAHVCGLNWDVIDPATLELVYPKWYDE